MTPDKIEKRRKYQREYYQKNIDKMRKQSREKKKVNKLKKQNKTCPECGAREVDRWCRYCSECRHIREKLSREISVHTWIVKNIDKKRERSRECMRRLRNKSA